MMLERMVKMTVITTVASARPSGWMDSYTVVVRSFVIVGSFRPAVAAWRERQRAPSRNRKGFQDNSLLDRSFTFFSMPGRMTKMAALHIAGTALPDQYR
jgi:hypothetical protein